MYVRVGSGLELATWQHAMSNITSLELAGPTWDLVLVDVVA